MNSLTGLLLTVIVFLTIAIIMIVIWQILLTFKPKSEKIHKPHLGEFKSRIILLSKRELEAYEQLRGLIKNRNLLLLSKIHLIDLVQPLGENEVRSVSLEIINNLLVDIVVCDKTTGKIMLAVELVDSQAEKRTAVLIKEVMERANIPLLHLDRNIKIEEIRKHIEAHFNK